MRVWDISTLEKVDAGQEEPRQPPSLSPVKGHSTAIMSIAFTPDGRLFASASSDGKVCLWDCVGGNIIGSFEEHEMNITSLNFSDSGKNMDLIFLPAQFRPSRSEQTACSVQDRKVVIGCGSGQVLFFKFSEKGPYLSRSDSLRDEDEGARDVLDSNVASAV